MPNLNLIKEPDNIRNRLRPKRNNGLRSLQMIVVAGIFIGGVWWLFFQEAEIEITPGAQVATDPVQSPLPTLPKPEEEVVVAKETEPTPKPAPPAVPTRPVAQAAKEVVPDQKTPAKWKIRFGVFAFEENSRSYVADLAKKGIVAQVVEGMAPIITYRVIYGPWPTGSQAKNEKKLLEKEGINTQRFMAGGKKYLSTKPLKSAKEAEALRQKGEKLGVRSEVSRKKETRRVFRVYKKKGYFAKKEAVKDQKRLIKKGIDNVVEQLLQNG